MPLSRNRRVLRRRRRARWLARWYQHRMHAMTRPASSIKVAAFAAVSLLASAFTGAQDRPATLRLAVEPSKADIVLGEPAYVTLTLTNTGSQPAKIQPDLNLESGFAHVRIAPAEGKAFTFVPLAIDDVAIAVRDLAPGASITAVNEIFFGGMGWSFRGPGNYEITATFRSPGVAQVTSDRVTVRVAEGDGAGRFLFNTEPATQLEAGKFLVWQQGDHLRRALRVLPE